MILVSDFVCSVSVYHNVWSLRLRRRAALSYEHQVQVEGVIVFDSFLDLAPPALPKTRTRWLRCHFSHTVSVCKRTTIAVPPEFSEYG